MLLKVILLSFIALIALRNEVSGKYSYIEKEIPNPITVGMSIQIEGQASSFRGKYQIKLQEGKDKPDGDIQLHMLVNFETDDTFLILNSLKKGEWREEEKYKLDNIPETARIFARKDHWEILVDGGNSFFFKYRKPIEELEKIKFLVADGSFETHLVTLCSVL